MRKLPFNFIGLAAATLLAFVCGNQSAQSADNLESMFKQTGWDRVIGTWVAENGTEATFAWKDGYIHSTTTMGDTNRNTTLKLTDGKVAVDSKDNKGGSSSGTAEFSSGKAVFTITATPAGGETRNLVIEYTLAGDSLTVQMQGQPNSTTFTRK